MRRRDRLVRSAARGFTLIEVMAAAVILGLVVAALTQIVMQGNLREGDARLRARAAALADRLIAEAEEAAARGAPLQAGSREVEEGDLRATIEVAPFDLVAFVAGTLAGDDEK